MSSKINLLRALLTLAIACLSLPLCTAQTAPTSINTNVPTGINTNVPTGISTNVPTIFPSVGTNTPTSTLTSAPTSTSTRTPTSTSTSTPTSTSTSTPTSTSTSTPTITGRIVQVGGKTLYDIHEVPPFIHVRMNQNNSNNNNNNGNTSIDNNDDDNDNDNNGQQQGDAYRVRYVSISDSTGRLVRLDVVPSSQNNTNNNNNNRLTLSSRPLQGSAASYAELTGNINVPSNNGQSGALRVAPLNISFFYFNSDVNLTSGSLNYLVPADSLAFLVRLRNWFSPTDPSDSTLTLELEVDSESGSARINPQETDGQSSDNPNKGKQFEFGLSNSGKGRLFLADEALLDGDLTPVTVSSSGQDDSNPAKFSSVSPFFNSTYEYFSILSLRPSENNGGNGGGNGNGNGNGGSGSQPTRGPADFPGSGLYPGPTVAPTAASAFSTTLSFFSLLLVLFGVFFL